MQEKTYMIFHPTRFAFLKFYTAAIALIAIGILIFTGTLPVPFVTDEIKMYAMLALVAIGAILFLVIEIIRRSDTYAITNRRIIEKTGLISIDEDSVYWESFSNYSFKQGVLDRLLNIGSVKLWSIGGEEEPPVVIKKSRNFKKIIYILDRLIQRR